MRGAQFWGPLALGGFCTVASVVPFPTFVAVLAAGFLLGVFLGSVVAILGTTIGACAAFLLARIVARRWAGGKIALGGRFAVLDRAVREKGFKIVLLSRLNPLGPFISVNYAFGLTQVSLGQYGSGTLIGGAPGTILYAFFGAGLHSLHEIITYSHGESQANAVHPVFFGASLIIAVGVSPGCARGTPCAPRSHAEGAGEAGLGDPAGNRSSTDGPIHAKSAVIVFPSLDSLAIIGL